MFICVYFGYPQKPYKTVQTVQTQAGQGFARVRFLLWCTVFVMVYGLDDFQFFYKSVLQQAAEIDIGIQSALVEPRRNSQRLFNRT